MEFSFKNNGLEPLSLKNILLKVDQLTLWKYYTSNPTLELFKTIKSPFREDRTPSFSLYVNDYGKVLGNDFRGDFHGDIIDYISKIIEPGLSFYQALVRINEDFQLDLKVKSDYTYKSSTSITHIGPIVQNNNTIKKNNHKIDFKSRKFNQTDIKFFKKQGISLKTLNKFNVFPVEKAFLNNEVYYTYLGDEDPCYAYFYPRTNKVKLYFPHRKTNRFLSNCTNESEFQGLWQLDKNKKELVITKSYKDIMLFYELGFNAIAPHGEGHRFPEKIINFINKNFETIILLFDNDLVGIKNSRRIRKEYGYNPYLINRRKYKNIKDLCELYKSEGYNQTFNFINKIINEEKYRNESRFSNSKNY